MKPCKADRADIRDGYWTVPCCTDGCWHGWFMIGSLRWFWRCHRWWTPSVARDAFRPRQCVACRGTGRHLVCEAAR